MEPFCGSCAVLLARPQPFGGLETVNDINVFLCNFWRSVAKDPDAVANAADWPVMECDLYARGNAIFYQDDWYKERGHDSVVDWVEWIRANPDHHDPLVAGWWVWGQSCWIGGTWGRDEKVAEGNANLANQMPELASGGRGVNRKMPHLAGSGRGIVRKGVCGSNEGDDILPRKGGIYACMRALARRLRNVRACCGQWDRILSPTITTDMGLTAVFLDPPYGDPNRVTVYGSDESFDVATDVRKWCKEHGDDTLLRIALCGYEGEHNELEEVGWTKMEWRASGGYASKDSQASLNRHKERVWFSPHCVGGVSGFGLEW